MGTGDAARETASAIRAAGASVAWIGGSDPPARAPWRRERFVTAIPPAPDAAWGRSDASLPDPASPLHGVDLVFVGAPTHDGRIGLSDLPQLGRTCELVARLAEAGQTIVLTCSCYVGCTHDLIEGPLERRGLRIGRDIHVAFSPERPGWQVATSRWDPGVRVVAGATPGCTRAAATVLGAVAPVRRLSSPEEVEREQLGLSSERAVELGAKRALDIIVAALALLVCCPVLALVAMAILLDDGRPLLFTQIRLGRDGRPFRVRKFRTMVDGAEHRLPEVLPLNQIHGPGFQLERDPRLTRIGTFLRRSSLDELPQLWNVLTGEMSLVGPRPAPDCEVVEYEPWHRYRLAVKPGLTGLAQIRARRYREFDQKARLDLEYIENWSIWLDLRILLRTVPTVLRMTGQ